MARTKKTKPQVTIIANWAPPETGASSARIQSMLDYLASSFRVSIIGPVKSGARKSSASIRLKLFTGGFNMFHFLASFYRLLRHFKRDKPVIIIGSTPTIFLPFQAALASWILRIPFVLDCRDNEAHILSALQPGMIAKIVNLLERLTISFSQMVLVTTKRQGSLLCTWHSLKNKKIEVVPNGVDLEQYKYSSHPKKFDLVFVGNLDVTRDPVRLLKCLALLKDARTLFIGIKKKRFLKYIGKVPSGLTIVPPVKPHKVFDYLLKAKIGLISISNEYALSYQMPVKIFEYMAAGLPVICLGYDTDSHLRKFFETYNIGMYVTKQSEFQQAVEQLRDKKLYNKISKQNLKTVNKFHRKEAVKELIPILTSLI